MSILPLGAFLIAPLLFLPDLAPQNTRGESSGPKAPGLFDEDNLLTQILPFVIAGQEAFFIVTMRLSGLYVLIIFTWLILGVIGFPLWHQGIEFLP
jgi:hypothetical protein